jgi:hypothetical protein
VLIPKALVVGEGAEDGGAPALPSTAERPIRLASRHAARSNGAIAEPAAITRPSALMPPAEPVPDGEADLPAADLPARDVPAASASGLPAADIPAPDWPYAGQSQADGLHGPDTRPFAVPSMPSVSVPDDGDDLGSDVPAPPFGAAPRPPQAPPAPTAPPTSPAAPAAEEESLFTPRRSRQAPTSSAFSSLGEELPADPDSSGPQDPPVDSDELARLGLPVRVRQASLAPQLRDRAPGTDGGDRTASAPSPEAARSIMTALQRGWERGRYISGSVKPPSDTTNSTESSGNGAENSD